MNKPKSHTIAKAKPYGEINLQSPNERLVRGINLDSKNSSPKVHGSTQWSGGIKYIDKRKGSMQFSVDGRGKFKKIQIKVSSFKIKKQKESLWIPITMRDIEPSP